MKKCDKHLKGLWPVSCPLYFRWKKAEQGVAKGTKQSFALQIKFYEIYDVKFI